MRCLIACLAILCVTALLPTQDQGPGLPESFRLTLHDVDGEPLREQTVRVIFATGDKHHFQLADTDRHGQLTLATPQGFRQTQLGAIRLQRIIWPDDPDSLTPARYAGVKKLSFAEAIERGPVLRLDPPNLLASGRVVDRNGKPLPGIPVAAGAHANGSLDNARAIGDGLAAYRMTVRSDALGRFAIHELGGGREILQLETSAEHHDQLKSRQHRIGASEIEIVMGRVSEVLARIHGVPVGQRVRFPARLVPQGTQPEQQSYAAQFTQGNGEIRFPRCLAGRYEFQLMDPYQRDGTPLLTVDDIQVKPGELSKDPRLAKLDVSDHYQWIKIDVRSTTDKGIHRAQVAVLRPNGRRNHLTRSGWTWVMIPTGGCTLEVTAANHRSATVQRVRRSQTIVLQPAWQVGLRISNLPELSASQVRCVLEIQGDARRHRSRTDPALSETFSSARQLHYLPIATAGKHRLRLYAIPTRRGARLDHESTPQGEHLLLGTHEFELQEDTTTAQPIPIHFALSAAQLAATMSFEAILKERER